MHIRTKIITGLLLVSSISVPGIASARTPWQRHHPARTEVNHRIRHQERRITEERREGDITHAQAHALRQDDRAILAQERADARANGHNGHLTRAQARQLNGELNANSRAIGR